MFIPMECLIAAVVWPIGAYLCYRSLLLLGYWENKRYEWLDTGWVRYQWWIIVLVSIFFWPVALVFSVVTNYIDMCLYRPRKHQSEWSAWKKFWMKKVR